MATLTTGTQIRNVARITFDSNAPIDTDQVSDTDPTLGHDQTKQALATIDAVPPTSTVAATPGNNTHLLVRRDMERRGRRGGSGLATYDVFVSDNNGPYTRWQTDTTATSATFAGVSGHTYAFYSLATDNVGNQQIHRPRRKRRPSSMGRRK